MGVIRYRTLLLKWGWVAAVAGMLFIIWAGALQAADVESKFYAAQRCAEQLKKNTAQQKYRDRWLSCINGFLGVYRHDPHGPWAAAGLFYAGTLFFELYQHSFLPADKQEAIDLLDRVERFYPSSRYSQKAVAEKGKIADLPQTAGTAEKDAAAAKRNSQAAEWYQKAQAKFQLLKQETRLQKNRDQWQICIDFYRNAYEADPQGELAASALSGLASSYQGLHKWSGRASDRLEADKALKMLSDQFPTSPFALQAQSQNEPQPVSTADPTDAIAQAIEKLAAQVSQTESNAPPGTSSASVVEGLRFWSNPRYTRVVIDANQNTEFAYGELREDRSQGRPQRIYIDVKNSRLSTDLQRVVPINDNLLRDARAGQYQPNTVRVVVDIKSAKTFKIFPLKNPFRIVLDVWGYDEDAGASAVAQRPGPVNDAHASLPASDIVRQLALGVRRVVIDPGHGGKDSGALGYYKGVIEKDVVLAISKRLAAMVRTQLKCEAVLTRTTDAYLSLEERTAIANTQSADLFISIHTNASPNHNASGLETFILNLASDDESKLVAAFENATSMKNISDLDSILKDLMQNAKVNESTRLAAYVQQAAFNRLIGKYEQIRNKGVKKAPFYVLIGAQMPSILVETAFISNPRDCKRLTDAAYQDLLCQGIVDGIKRYMEETNPIALREPASGGG